MARMELPKLTGFGGFGVPIFKGNPYVRRIERGSTGTFRIGDFIFKADGEQRARELRVYRKLRPIDRKHFPPLLASGRRKDPWGGPTTWLIQPFMKQRGGPISKAQIDKLEELSDRYQIGDVEVCGKHNWFISASGHVVIYDFGMPLQTANRGLWRCGQTPPEARIQYPDFYY